jgi:NADPH-ferrihemoprotein reductase
MLALRNLAISARRSGPRLLSSSSSIGTSTTLFSSPTRLAPAASPQIHRLRRWFSAAVVQALSSTDQPAVVQALSSTDQPVKILWASQCGTAQIFAHQLSEALQESGHDQVVIQGWHESKSPDTLLTPGKGLHVFLCSVAGVGDPPDNGRAFYEHIMTNPAQYQGLEYAVFGLGNSKAHSHHYNAIGKSLDLRLEELGASRVLELGLGDDGDCIEDDFDMWTEKFVQLLKGEPSFQEEKAEEGHQLGAAASEPVQQQEAEESQLAMTMIPAPGIDSSDSGSRLRSAKYPALNLRPRENDCLRPNLFHLQGTSQQFYQDGTGELDVIGNKRLAVNSGEQGLLEMKIALRNHHDKEWFTYETGDHLMLYPQNSPCIVQAYLDVLDVDRHAIIVEQQDISYPHPTGITVFETLTHCVDLGATPSPPFARKLLGRKELNYKDEIASPRRTIIDLLQESGKRFSLEDVLYNMTPMTHRYYSIASSNRAHPSEIYLTYRPVKYMTSRGMLREGTATSYMTDKAVAGEGAFCHLAAKVNSNPAFRLPRNPMTPILMIAGGCGVAPIRAFLEERIALNLPDYMYGPGTLYLGFRNPTDEVYRKLIQSSIERGALTEAKVAYSAGTDDPNQKRMNVTELVREQAKEIFEHFQAGGFTYICGGAHTLGAAVEAELLEIIQEHGNMDFENAQKYFIKLVEDGRLCEDLAD